MDPNENDPSKRGKRKRLREAKEGKRDFIEDYLPGGSEELSGVYEEREKMAKMFEAEKQWVKNFQRKKAEKIRKAELKRQKEIQQNKIVNINRYVEFILYNTLTEEAFQFMNELRQNNPQLCYKIVQNFLIPKEEQLQLLVQLILKYGPQRKIDKAMLLKIVYRIRGYERKMERVDKDGERRGIFEEGD